MLDMFVSPGNFVIHDVIILFSVETSILFCLFREEQILLYLFQWKLYIMTQLQFRIKTNNMDKVARFNMIAGAESSPIKSRNTTNKTTDFCLASSKPIASYKKSLDLIIR